MKSITAGLCLVLVSGVAMAQTPPTTAGTSDTPSASPPALTVPVLPHPSFAPPSSTPGHGMPPSVGAGAANSAAGPRAQTAPDPGAGPTPNAAGMTGAPEGEIIETPSGFYLVRPGQPPSQVEAEGTDGHPAADGMMPRPRPPHPRPESKGARLVIHEPNLNIDVKCPDDEPIKACVDAISQLLDKAAAPRE